MTSESNSVQEYFSDKETCIKEIHNTREMFSNPKSTEKHFDAFEHGLIMMTLYCPEELRIIVEATREELQMRKELFNFGEYVIRSQTAYGFWSNDQGWVYDVDSATKFTAEEKENSFYKLTADEEYILVQNVKDFDIDLEP